MARTYQPAENSTAAPPAPSVEAESPGLFELMGNAFAATQLSASGGAGEDSGGWGFGGLGDLWDEGTSWAGGVVDDAAELGSGLVDDAMDFGGELLVDAVEYAEDSGLADTVVHVIGDAMDGAEDAIDFVAGVGSDVADLGSDVIDWVAETGAPLVEEAQEFVAPLIDAGGGLLDWVVDQGSSLIGPLLERGGELVDLVVDRGTELISPLIDAGSEAIDWALDQGADLLGPALDLGSDIFGWVMDRGSELTDSIGDLWNKGGEVLEDIAEIFGADTENAGPLSDAMSEDQLAFLHELYGDSLDLSQVRFTRDGLTPMIAGAPNTTGNTINLVSKWGPDIFDENGQITSEGMELVIHELAHVWQYQNDGWDYMPEAIWANAYHTVVDGDRDEAYRYDTSMDWEGMNPEQQGHAVEKAGYLLWRQSQGEVLTADELKTLGEHQKYVDAVRAGQGA